MDTSCIGVANADRGHVAPGGGTQISACSGEILLGEYNMMRRLGAIIIGFAGFLCLITAPAGAAAAQATIINIESGIPVPSDVAACDAESFCWYSGVNYTGLRVSILEMVHERCYSMPSSLGVVRSYTHRTTSVLQEGYFYSNGGCTGRSYAVVRGSGSPDIGFNAYTFRAACVSCRNDK